VDYFNKMAEFVLVAEFDTHKCRKKSTTLQKFKKPDDFRQSNAKKNTIVPLNLFTPVTRSK